MNDHNIFVRLMDKVPKVTRVDTLEQIPAAIKFCELAIKRVQGKPALIENIEGFKSRLEQLFIRTQLRVAILEKMRPRRIRTEGRKYDA